MLHYLQRQLFRNNPRIRIARGDTIPLGHELAKVLDWNETTVQLEINDKVIWVNAEHIGYTIVQPATRSPQIVTRDAHSNDPAIFHQTAEALGITVRDLARSLGVSESAMYAQMKAGKVPRLVSLACRWLMAVAGQQTTIINGVKYHLVPVEKEPGNHDPLATHKAQPEQQQ